MNDSVLMVMNTPSRHQKKIVPNFECRPRPFLLSIATAPVITAASPNRTWTPTIARNTGSVDGIGMPRTTDVFSLVMPTTRDGLIFLPPNNLLSDKYGFLAAFGDMTLWSILDSCVVLPDILTYLCVTHLRL